jgi:type I restriction enzyme S subunit
MRPYLRAANVDWNGLKLDDVKEMNFTDDEAEVYRLRAGDIVLSEASGSPGEVGKPALWNDEINDCCFQNTLIRVRGRCVEPRYLLYYLRHVALSGALVEHSRGVGIHHIGAARMAAWAVPVPPLAEQRRIVATLEGHLFRLETGRSQLELVVRRIEILRGRVIDDACTGVGMRGAGQSSAEMPVPAGVVDGALPELPKSWHWRRLGSFAEVVGGVTKDAKKQSDPSLPEVPYLRVANVQRGKLNLDQVARIRVPPEKAKALALQSGDVLMNEGGDRDKLGRGWVWEGQIAGCIHQNHVLRARINDDVIEPKLLAWYANGVARNWFDVNGRQGGFKRSMRHQLLAE